MSKIALIAPTSLPSRRANTIQVMKMAQGISACGHDLLVISPKASEKSWSEPAWTDLEGHYGLHIVFPVIWLQANPLLRSYDFGYRAVTRARAWGADCIFTRHPQAAAYASLRGLPTILEIHDFPQGVAGPRLLWGFLRGSGARKLVSISQALLNDLSKRFNIPSPIDCLVAPDGVDIERYADLPGPVEARSMLNLPDRFTAGYTGHLYPGRGVDIILEIAARLPDFTFLLTGGNPEDVERYSASASGLPNVIFTGFIPNKELPLYQAASDVLLMPYQRNVAASSGGDIGAYLSPMKLFEYLASGRPVLSSDLPVLREILDADNAVLLPPEQVDAWADAIVELRHAPERRNFLGHAGVATAKEHTWQARAARILSGLG